MATGAAAALAVSPVAAQAAGPISDESTIERILGGMTLREKLGQMFIISANGTDMTDWYREQLLHLQPGGRSLFRVQRRLRESGSGLHRCHPTDGTLFPGDDRCRPGRRTRHTGPG